jgi:rhomboid protease GluP
MKWKLRRCSNSIEEYKERFREIFQGTLSKQKVCPACRALVSAKDKRCPFCNESLSAFDRVDVRRAAVGFLPEINYTTILLGANFFFFALSLLAATKSGLGWEGLISGFPRRVLVDLGANYAPGVFYGEYWRLISGAFLHANLMHLLFNMMVLFDVGPAVEEMYGPSRFISLYVFACLTGSLASYWYHFPFGLMVGASGALFGLIGVMVAYGYRHRTALAEQIRSMYLRWAIYGLIFGLMMPGVDNAAHIGGLAGGVLFGWIVSDMPPVTRESIFFWRMMNYTCWLVLAACLLLVALNYRRLS